jgi:hypothetical protein
MQNKYLFYISSLNKKDLALRVLKINCLYMITRQDITFKVTVYCRGNTGKIQSFYKISLLLLPAS